MKNVKLSEHFKLSEFTKSQLAEREGIDNDLIYDRLSDGIVIDHLALLVTKVIEPVRQHYSIPFSPNSGYRSLALEAILCRKAMQKFIERGDGLGKDYLAGKQHPTGKAADIEMPGVSNLNLAKWIRDNLEFDQLILEFYREGVPGSGWVHVSYTYDTLKRRRQVLTYANGRYDTGLPD